jgi:hypothetical protein
MLKVEVDDEPRHLALPDVEDIGSVRCDLPDLEPARPAAPSPMCEHEDALAVELTELVRLDPELLPRTDPRPRPLRQAGQPSPLAWRRPSAITYSISGCAHSTELKSPRSQSA